MNKEEYEQYCLDNQEYLSPENSAKRKNKARKLGVFLILMAFGFFLFFMWGDGGVVFSTLVVVPQLLVALVLFTAVK
jgi:cell division septal protein FtsQ